MAIDLMIMPLSRYWSGDFVTPEMQQCWRMGVPYHINRPGHPAQEFPQGVPYGGEDAPKRRREFIDLEARYIATLPPEASNNPWDAASDVEPAFFRLEPASFRHLFGEALAKLAQKPGFFQRLTGKQQRILHLTTATVFLPATFPDTFQLDKKTIGSLPTLQAELTEASWSNQVKPSLEIYKEAVRKALKHCLPMIVDL